MSVINETLDNLKQNRKQPKALNPSSSVYREKILKSEKPTIAKNSYLIPFGFAVSVGLLFYLSHWFFSDSSIQNAKNPANQLKSTSWFKDNLKKFTKPSLVKVSAKHLSPIIDNVDAKNQYYQAVALLNEGNDHEALLCLQKIIAKYPDFSPAQTVYATLKAH